MSETLINKPLTAKPMVSLAGLSIPKWIFFSLLTIILYGLMGVVAKFASNTISPYLVQIISSFGMVPLLLMLILKKKAKKQASASVNAGIIFSVLVGILSVVAAVSQFLAYSKGGPASIVVPVISLASLVTILMARIVFGDKLNTFQLVGIVLSIIAILMFNSGGGDLPKISGPWWKTIFSSWMIFSLLGLFAAGTAQFFIKSATNHVSSDLVTVVVLFTTLVLTVVLVFTQSFSWDMSLKDLIACLVVGILGSAAFLTQSVAYSSGITSVVAPLCSLFPVVTVIVSALFLGEKLTVILIIAVVISTVAGVVLSIEERISDLKVPQVK
jgi:uncharacterized membrane protein